MGKDNHLADALSLQPLSCSEAAGENNELPSVFLLPEITSKEQIVKELLDDEKCDLLHTYLHGDEMSVNVDQLHTLEQQGYYTITDELLYYTKNCNSRGKYRLVIPNLIKSTQ